MIEDFWNELCEEEIHARDNLQFELKTEFSVNPLIKNNVYKQQLYIFIPSSLQINFDTYSKQRFYLDQTNFIRYKTPTMSLSNLLNLEYSLSPLTRLHHLLYQSHPVLLNTASDELKLFGAIFRNTIRERISIIIKHLNLSEEDASHSVSIEFLCTEITEVCRTFRELQTIAQSHSDLPQLIRSFKYIDEYISTGIEEFLNILIKDYREIGSPNDAVDSLMTQVVIREKLYRMKNNLGPKTVKGHTLTNEAILYRQSLLNHYVLESLMLKNIRSSIEEKHRNILGGLAAGIAMLVYMTLFVWKSSTLVINSFPFVALAVVLYILKDRMKEGFKSFYSKRAHRWFPDYATVIKSFKGYKAGKLKENFSFVDLEELPPDYIKIRNYHFHEELQALHRHETIIQYKREMLLTPPLHHSGQRRKEVTAIFRLNIRHFLEKANNAIQAHLTMDVHTKQISERLLPKIYHLNLILHNSYIQDDLTQKEEIKTYRVVVDKNGIKRVEHIL